MLEKLEADLKKVENLFKRKNFAGDFDMSTFGDCSDDKPDKNFCGTSACLAGWLATVQPKLKSFWDFGILKTDNSNDMNLVGRARSVYGLNSTEANRLFYGDIQLSGKDGLKKKITQARLLIRAKRENNQKLYQKFMETEL